MSKLVQIIKDSAVIILIGLSALALFFIAKALGITPSGIARWLRKFTGKTATPENPEVAEKKSEEKKVESVNTDEMEYKKSSKKTIQKIDDLLKELE